jgi:hypothetical protein
MLLTIGDSFTYGTELSNTEYAWPYQLAKRLDMTCVNLAQPGASNDFIVRTTVNAIEEYNPLLLIVAFTTPNRFERNGDHFTPNKTPQEFFEWNDEWAQNKFHTQVKMLETYIPCENYFLGPWDIDISYCKNYIGTLVELCEGFDKGIGGHPLIQGHTAIAKRISKIISQPSL